MLSRKSFHARTAVAVYSIDTLAMTRTVHTLALVDVRAAIAALVPRQTSANNSVYCVRAVTTVETWLLKQHALIDIVGAIFAVESWFAQAFTISCCALEYARLSIAKNGVFIFRLVEFPRAGCFALACFALPLRCTLAKKAVDSIKARRVIVTRVVCALIYIEFALFSGKPVGADTQEIIYLILAKFCPVLTRI
jgi:hypothetical protein